MGKEDGIVTAKESDKAITFVHDFNVRNSSFIQIKCWRVIIQT